MAVNFKSGEHVSKAKFKKTHQGNSVNSRPRKGKKLMRGQGK